MYAKNVTVDQVRAAVDNLNKVWNDNIVLENVKQVSKNVVSFKLGTADSKAEGSRTSASGRHGRYACTHVFADIMQELLNEGASFTRLFTGLTVENQRDLDQHVDQAHHKNAGSMMFPVSMAECCVDSFCTSKIFLGDRDAVGGYWYR